MTTVSASLGRRWSSQFVLPFINLALAAFATGLVVLVIYWGHYRAGDLSFTEYLYTPFKAARLLFIGSVGNLRNLSYTLFYATDFIFAGLAVCIAAHAGLFNLGAEGQAYISGLGVALVCLYLSFLPPWLVIPLAIVVAAVFGAAWAAIPAYLQAKRGSHVVITTIMLNFIASAVMVYVLVHILVGPGQMSPATRRFASGATLLTITDIIKWFGGSFNKVPLNVSFLWALLCVAGVQLFIWRSRAGYAFRTVGHNSRAARYGGISVGGVTMAAMCLSGAMAGFIALNEVMGAQQRLVLNFVAGAGYVGVAVSLMGRNKPIGVVLSSLLFGAIYQGGVQLTFEMPEITRDMAIVIQGLIILFTGALEHLVAPRLHGLLRVVSTRKVA